MSGHGNTHWCYQCLERVRLRGDNPICPYCHGGFVQELNDNFGPFHGFMDPFPNPRNRIMDSGFMEPFPNPRNRIMDAFAEIITQRMAERNPSFAFEFFNGVPAGSRHSNVGSIFTGTALEDLIEQLIANDGSHGPPPATQSAIDSLPFIRITNRHLNMESHCPVCQDKFDLGSEARMMPCNHIYHSGCIVPWLLEHNSCPVCRLELPPQGSSTSRNSNSNSEHSETGRNPLSFLWPFGS
ncbi:hypothetical protein L1887_24622 [Cichorium endivia]|nr:hypothetical protein L1887_24622 [Cichorium endivia]